MGGGELHQALRSLCFNTDWNYAVFWKLNHHARMMLTWEDAYYDNHEQTDPSGSNCFGGMMSNSHDGHNSHDLLGLAVAKMSYHAYSLGEGIVGQVFATGKHLWICGDKNGTGSFSSLQHCDGWQAQFSAGIRTIAVVAVVPHGVVQLGSFSTIAEDLNLVNHIKDIFSELQGSLMEHISSAQPCSIDCSSCLSDVLTRGSSSTNFLHSTKNFDKTAERNLKNSWSPMFPSFETAGDYSRIMELHGGSQRLEHSAWGLGFGGNVTLLQPVSEKIPIEQHEQFLKKEFSDRVSEGTSMCVSEPSNVQTLQVAEKNDEFYKEINRMEMLKTSFEFPAGCELYEALGPSFHKQRSQQDLETRKTETETTVALPEEGICSSYLLTAANSGAESLLEAVVANICHSGSDARDAKSLSKSEQSILTTGKLVEPPSGMQTSGSTCYSFDRVLVEEGTLHSFDQSSQGMSSTSHSRCSEQLDRPHEQTKNNRKRARPGESCRPRPRDRQLIQDRIKELRELVPNGSKCSIDSLLERTIKHMLFMQCVTKHTDKIDKCAESKLLNKETVLRGSSSHDQGSSWAMEVGGHLKVCPIIVENINANGQMLVEMLCEECIHFLEIAEAIRSLGLTILKGVTEAYGERTWMCFVVENNRSMHRMDILWSLVQMLQSKSTT